MTTHQDTNTERNCRVQERYDELMQAGKHGHYESMFRVVREEVDAALASRDEAAVPIPMMLHCPVCGKQHIDAPDPSPQFAPPDDVWTNPPHRSHKCHDCGTIWRPADVATTGVERIETQGKEDTWRGGDYTHAVPAAQQPQGQATEALANLRASQVQIDPEIAEALNRPGVLFDSYARSEPQGQSVSDDIRNKFENIVSGYSINADDEEWLRAILSLRDKSVVKESLTTERVPLSDGRKQRDQFERKRQPQE